MERFSDKRNKSGKKRWIFAFRFINYHSVAKECLSVINFLQKGISHPIFEPENNKNENTRTKHTVSDSACHFHYGLFPGENIRKSFLQK